MVEGLLERARLAVAGDAEVDVPFQFANHDAAWQAHASVGPVQKAIDLAGRDAVRAALVEVLEADRKPDGSLRQDNVFRYVLATK